MPSFSADSVSFCHWSRPWCAAISDSLRVSVYFTGLPSRRATAQAINSSGVAWSLPPKPPPTSGAIDPDLRLRAPRWSPRARSAGCGGSGSPTTSSAARRSGRPRRERGSMKAGISRCWRYSRSITMPSSRALLMASSTSLPVPASPESKTQSADLLVPRSGCASTLSVGRGFLEVERGRQLVVLHVDELGGVARLGGAAGDHHGDDLAGEGDPVGRHRRVGRRLLVGRDRPGVDADARARRRSRRR